MNAKIKLNTTVYTLSLPSPIYSSPQQICGMLKMKCSMLECSSMQSMKSNSQSAVSVDKGNDRTVHCPKDILYHI